MKEIFNTKTAWRQLFSQKLMTLTHNTILPEVINQVVTSPTVCPLAKHRKDSSLIRYIQPTTKCSSHTNNI